MSSWVEVCKRKETYSKTKKVANPSTQPSLFQKLSSEFFGKNPLSFRGW